eukprot:2291047-Rhodomonas_salina.1
MHPRTSRSSPPPPSLMLGVEPASTLPLRQASPSTNATSSPMTASATPCQVSAASPGQPRGARSASPLSWTTARPSSSAQWTASSQRTRLRIFSLSPSFSATATRLTSPLVMRPMQGLAVSSPHRLGRRSPWSSQTTSGDFRFGRQHLPARQRVSSPRHGRVLP